MSVKRTYSRTGSPARRFKRGNSIASSPSHSQSSQNVPASQSLQGGGSSHRLDSSCQDDPFCFSDACDACPQLIDNESSQPSGGASKPRLNPLAYHKMSTGVPTRKSVLQTKQSGRFTAKMDEMTFHLDGLGSSDKNVQHLSACSIASLCSSSEVRMHMRMAKGDTAAALLSTLGKSLKIDDADLALAAGCILYFVSRDTANLEYFRGDEIVLLRCLLVSESLFLKEESIHLPAATKLSKLGSKLNGSRKAPKDETTADKIRALLCYEGVVEVTVRHLALLSLLAVADQPNLKDDFRTAGVLDYLSELICRSMNEGFQSLRKRKCARDTAVLHNFGESDIYV